MAEAAPDAAGVVGSAGGESEELAELTSRLTFFGDGAWEAARAGETELRARNEC